VDYGRIKKSGALVHVSRAARGGTYLCPTCGLPLELRRGPNREYFAHRRGLEGTRECELFVPGQGGGSESASGSQAPDARVEDDPFELGLILDHLDGEWSLGLRLPEIPHDELGEVSLGELRPAQVEVVAGGDVVSRISALDLRPGVGAARIPVPPTLREYRARTAGAWPRTINTERWQLQSRGLEAKGTLFRLRRGEWTRLLADSGVHHGERLLVLADTGCSPPAPIVCEVHAKLSSGGLHWAIWEVQIPDDALVSNIAEWLDRIGHSLVPRPWSVTLVTPARAYSERGEPVFWLGDSPVLALEAPMPGAAALAILTSGSNSHRANVRVAEDKTTHVVLESRSVGLARFRIIADRSASLDCVFVERPSQLAVLELLAQTPRLRIWLGERCFEPWRGSRHTVHLTSRALPEIRVDLGGDTVRARVTVWERGKQRSYRSLSAREVATTIKAALAIASLVEIDADNLGRIELAPALSATRARDKAATHNRLAWYEHVQSILTRRDEHTVPTVLEHPRMTSALIARSVGSPALVRGRLALRRRRATGGALR
jgi:hypothetical protein